MEICWRLCASIKARVKQKHDADAIFQFLKVRRTLPENNFWKPCKPVNLNNLAAMKSWEILHQENYACF